MGQHRCGHHGGQGGIVEFAHVIHDRPAQPAYAIVIAVGVKVGPEVTADG